MPTALRLSILISQDVSIQQKVADGSNSFRIDIKMARTGYAKGANSGHITTERPKKVKPSHRKGVSLAITIGQFEFVECLSITTILFDRFINH